MPTVRACLVLISVLVSLFSMIKKNPESPSDLTADTGQGDPPQDYVTTQPQEESEEKGLLVGLFDFTVRIWEKVTPPFFQDLPLRFLLEVAMCLFLMNVIVGKLWRFKRKDEDYVTRESDISKEILTSAMKKSARNHAEELKAVKRVLNQYRRWYAIHMRTCKMSQVNFGFFEALEGGNDANTCFGDVQEIRDDLHHSEYILLIREVKKRDRKILDMSLKMDYTQSCLESLRDELKFQLSRYDCTEHQSPPNIDPRKVLEELAQKAENSGNAIKEWTIEETDLYDGGDYKSIEDEILSHLAETY